MPGAADFARRGGRWPSSSSATALSRGDIWIIATSSVEPAHDVVAARLHRDEPRYAKGLEADHVVVCDLPSEFDDTGTAALLRRRDPCSCLPHILASKADKKRLKLLPKAAGGKVTLTKAQQITLAHLRAATSARTAGRRES